MPRKEERKTYRTEVLLECMSGRQDSRISDLSAGGCYVDSIAPVNVGERINFDLMLANGEAIRLSGVVAHVYAGIGFGVEFIDLSDTAKSALENLVRE